MGHALFNERTILLLIGLVGWLYARITSELRKAAKAREAQRQAQTFGPSGVDPAVEERARRVREEVARKIAGRRMAPYSPPPSLEFEPPPVVAGMLPVIRETIGGAAGPPDAAAPPAFDVAQRALDDEQRERDRAHLAFGVAQRVEGDALHLSPPAPTVWAALLREPATARQALVVSEILRSPRERYHY